MKFYSQLVLTVALSMVFMVNPCLAEEATQPTAEAVQADESGQGADESWKLSSGEIEVGAGHVSDDSFKFGRYTGLNEEGVYAIGGLDLQFSQGDAEHMRIIGTDLGLDSRNILFEYGRQGKFDSYIEYDQLPNFLIDSAVTPFNGAGRGNLTLPSGFDINNLEASLQELDIETERKHLEAGFSFIPKKHWKIGLSVSRETKQGTGIIGGALGNASAGSPVGNTVTALLPEPIDYVTNKLGLALEYADQKKQWKLNYQMSLFDNQQESLSWEDPFSGGGRADTGRLALPPSNQFHQISFSGAYALTPKTRLSGLLSTGLMLQDEDFLPFSTDTGAAPLPSDSLDGEVQVHSARFSITSRPIRPLRLKASYNYDEHNNNTRQEQYTFSFLDSTRTDTAVNEPLSYERHQVDLSAKYRFNRYVDTLLGYQYKKTERLFSDVEENDENKLSGELKLHPRNDLDLALRASRMQRDSSDFQAESANQNPLLRKYNLADVEQDTAGISLYYTPNPIFSIGLSGDLTKEDYTDSALGLTETERPTYTLDLSLIPRENISLYAFYTREEFDTEQIGFGPFDRDSAESNWQADIEDKIDTYGAGIKFTGIKGKMDLGADLVYTKAESDIDTAHDDPNATAVPYPTLSNELKSFKLYALYRFKQAVAVKLSYLHEEFESDDWALDGVDPGTAPSMILLGNESPEYDNDVVMASVIYRF